MYAIRSYYGLVLRVEEEHRDDVRLAERELEAALRQGAGAHALDHHIGAAHQLAEDVSYNFV